MDRKLSLKNMLEGKQLFLRKRRFGNTGRIEKVCSPFCRSRIVDGYAGRWMPDAPGVQSAVSGNTMMKNAPWILQR